MILEDSKCEKAALDSRCSTQDLSIFNALAIGQAAMMVHVIYEWDTQFFANAQQILGRVDSIIVL